MALFFKTAIACVSLFPFFTFAGENARYRYKVERGAYIESSRKETFSVCPDKEIQGTWISEYSVDLNAENCLSVQAPNLAGTIHILFMQNSGRTDTIQVLVEQSYIQMGDYSHSVWVPDSMPSLCRTHLCLSPAFGYYENRSYSQPLIVDKTKLTMGDAQHYSKIRDVEIEISPFVLKEYPKNENLKESRLPCIGYISQGWRYANERSKMEGLDTAYHIIPKNEYNSKETGKFILLGKDYDKDNFFAVDTLASGYKMPSNDEWTFLMRAGASTKYYWGDEEDSLTVSRYAWVRPVGFKPVAQLLPNRFGLYDMVGLTKYEWVEIYGHTIYDNLRNKYKYEKERDLSHLRSLNSFEVSCGYGYFDKRYFSPECYFINKIGPIKQFMGMPSTTRICTSEESDEWKQECVDFDEPVLLSAEIEYASFRLLRKTPKLHKLEKF